MKTHDEIRHIITVQLGITDQTSYKRYCEQFVGEDMTTSVRCPTPEEIELLSPDLIDNRAFWQIAQELFKTDAVSNCLFKDPVDIAEANKRNMTLYYFGGFTGLVDWAKASWGNRLGILEIGPGYGAFKDWIMDKTGFAYFAADVNPLIKDVDETDRTGLLSAHTKGRHPFPIIVSNNVFQHFSVNQRRTYYADLWKLLIPGGMFMVSMMVDMGHPNKARDPEGRVWCRHYGQFTQIQTEGDIIRDLKAQGFEIVTSQIYHSFWITLMCYKPYPKPEEPALVTSTAASEAPAATVTT